MGKKENKVDPDNWGPLKHLPGKWESKGKGWNMIALPFAKRKNQPIDYRLLLNQYDEDLTFEVVDSEVANRGVIENKTKQYDQLSAALSYTQEITQIAVGEAEEPEKKIHHETGLWLYMRENPENPDVDIARLATIPHGNAVLAIGKHKYRDTRTSGGFSFDHNISDHYISIDEISGLPLKFNTPLTFSTDTKNYLAPYKHYHDNPFKGKLKSLSGFEGFDPTKPNALLQSEAAKEKENIRSTTLLEVDTRNQTAGISNMPFIVKHAEANSMKSKFWIYELSGDRLILQYSQIVNIDFFGTTWPHISINTLEKKPSHD